MCEWIALRIMNAYESGGTAAGQGKYRAYFINTSKMSKYKSGVDSILSIEGYIDCIVAKGEDE